MRASSSGLLCEYMARKILAAIMLVLFALLTCPCSAQETEGARKVVNKVSPAYPPLARQMHIGGSVRLEAVVAPNGKVKSVDVKGGHPVLIEAATDAVTKWTWEATGHESRERVELRFLPSD